MKEHSTHHEMNPEPLDLDVAFAVELERLLLDKYGWEVDYGAILVIFDEIKQRIKQACDGFLDEIKQLEQEDGVICTDFDELQSIFKEWFAEVMEDD